MVKKARIIEDLGKAYGPLTSVLTPAYQAKPTAPTATAPAAAAPATGGASAPAIGGSPPAVIAPTGSTAAPVTGGLTSVVVPPGATTNAAATTTNAATVAPTVNKAPADIRAATASTSQKGISPFLGAAGAIGVDALLTSILSGNKGTTLVDKAKDLISKNPVTDAVGSVVGAAKDKLTSILSPTTKPATTTPATTTPATKPATTPTTKPATTTAPKTGTTPASSTDPLTSAVINGLSRGLTSGATAKPGAKAEGEEGEEEGDEELAEEDAQDDTTLVDLEDDEEDVAYKDDDLNEDITVADEGESDELVADAEDEFDEAGMDDATMPESSNAFAGGDAEPTDENPTSNAEKLQELLSTPEGEDILRQVMISTALESDASLADDPEFEAKIDQAMDQLRGMSTEDISNTISGESPLQQAANESSDAIQEAADNSLSNLVGEQPDQAPAETSPLTQVAQEQAPAPAPEPAPAPAPTPAPEQQPQDQPASPLTQVAQEQPAPAPEQQPQSPLTQVAQEQPQTPVEQATTAAQETMNSSPLTEAMDNLSNSAAEPEIDYDKLFADYMNSVGGEEPSGYAEPTQTDPGLSVPDFTPPDFEVPDFTAPDFEMPDFEMPDFEMPDFEMPDFEMPDFEMPDLSYDAGDYDSGSYDTGGYDDYGYEDYKRGGRVMRKAKGGLSSLRHFTPGGGVDGEETDETTSIVGYGQGDVSDDTPVGYVDDDLDVDITEGNFEEEDVGDGVVAYRDSDDNVVKVVGADGTNITREYVNPNGSLVANTGLRGAPVDLTHTGTTPAVKTTTGTQPPLSTRGTNEDVDATTVRAATNTNNPATTSFLTDIQNLLTNPTVKTGITGALLAELLGGQTDKSNKGVNVGSYAGFAPRTTPFGMGAARQVSLGAANALPQDQNTQLMASLGVPGYGFAPPTPTPYTEPVQIQYPGTPPVSEPAPPPNTMVATGGLVHLAGGGMPRMPNMPAPQSFTVSGRFPAQAPVPLMAPKVQQPGPMPMQPKPQIQTYTGMFAPARPMPTRPVPQPKRYYADGGMAGGEDGGTDPQQMPGTAGQTGGTHYTFGMAVDPLQVLGVRKASGGLSSVSEVKADVPVVQGRKDYRQGAYVSGAGDGQSDDIPAMLADGEYVMDAELVSMLGNGSNKAGAKVLDQFRQQIREHKRSAPLNKIPPKAKSPLAYLKGVK